MASTARTSVLGAALEVGLDVPVCAAGRSSPLPGQRSSTAVLVRGEASHCNGVLWPRPAHQPEPLPCPGGLVARHELNAIPM
eukprot:8640116-Pyramimonas_sp.AAC.1